MINVSQTIKNSCKADKNTHTEYIIINNQTIYIKGKLNATAYKDTTFFGTFNMKVLEFETENTTQFRNREFEYYKVIDGNAFKVGTFITTEVVDNDSDENIKVTANDYALKFAVPYTSELDYGSGEITLYDVLEECCNQVGVELENKFIDNNSFKVDSNQFVNGELVGDVICAIAGISGNFATITNEDKLRLTFTNGTGAEQTATIDGTTKINASELKSIELLPKTTQETTTGKNKCPNNLTSGTASGITYTKNNDGSIKITGTASARVEPDLYNNSSNPIVFPAGTYKNTSNRMIILFTGGYNVLYANSTLTLNSSISVTRIYFRIENGESNLNETFYPQIIVNGQSETYEPYTGGIASPNPNYPQNIETITGENTIKVVGKNLLPISTLSNTTTNGITFTNNNDGSYTLNGTATGYTAFNLFTNLSFNGNYTYVLKDTATSGFALYIQSSSAGVGSTTTHTTINNNVAKLIIGIQQGTALSNLTIKPYVYSGNYDSTIEYEPYQEKVAKLNLGKNLINPYSTNIGTSNGITTTYNEDQSLSFSGTITSTWAYLTNQYSSGKINLNIPSGDYTFSIDKASSDYTTIIRLFYDSSNYQDITINKNTTSRTASVSNNTIAYQIYIGGLTSGTELNETLHFQLEKGSTATDYSPYFTPIELCKIGDYQDRLFKASGKNLFENIDMENAYITSTGEYQASTSNALYPYTKVKGGEKIILSTQIAVRGLSINEYNSAKTFIKRTQVNTGSNNTTINTITLDNNASYIRIVINYDNTSNFNQDTIDTLLVQLEYGNSRSEYEPYGNYWYKYNAIGKVVLDGSESGWALFFSTNGVFVNNNVVSSISNATGINCISNYFSNTYSRSYIRSNLDSVDNVCATNLAELILANKSISSVNDFKTWLSTHNTIVYYILATPTYTKIDNEELIGQLDSIKTLDLFDGINNITTNAPFFLTYLDGDVEILEDYTKLEDKRDTQPITSVSIGTSQVEGQEAILRDENLIAQYGEHWLVINDNPLAYTLEKRQQLIGEIFNKVKGFGYSSFKSEYTYRPYLELGDKIKFRNKNGDLIDSTILRYNFDFDNCTFEAPSITSATINYELSPDADEKAKRAEIIANQADASITAITQELQIDEDGNSQVIESIRTTQTQNSLDIEAITSYEEINGVRTLTGVKTTTGFTFNSKGLTIQSSNNTYRAIHNETGEYYYDGDTPLGETTNEGSKYKNMELFGEFRYGKNSIDKNAMFVDMLYEDESGEKCFGTFYNGGEDE